MTFEPTAIPDVIHIQPRVLGDDRGYFLEAWREDVFAAHGIPPFVQDNESSSRRNVLRGLHFQKAHPQGKLVRVVRGEVFDAAVDIRRGSPTFGCWVGETLSGERHNMLWVPGGFAHGFCVLSDEAVLLYRCTEYYHPEDDRGIRWNDPEIGIVWPLDGEPVLSGKDRGLPFLKDADLP